MDASPDPDVEAEIDSLKGTTTTYPVGESADESAEEQSDELVDERDVESTTPQWQQLTVMLRTSEIDTLPEMAINATHPTYSVRGLPVDETGKCTLWVPETVDVLDVVLSFPTLEQDNISVSDIIVEEQEVITIPIVILSQEL